MDDRDLYQSAEPQFNIFPQEPELAPPAPHAVPNIGHALLFGLSAAVVIFLVESVALGVAMGLHLLPHKTPAQLAREPLIIIPAMASSYLLTLFMAYVFFPLLWQRSFGQGIHWNLPVAVRRGIFLVLTGVSLGLAIQWLSNYLPMPKSLPMDDFFRTRRDVWMVTGFGIFLAPVFEEIGFRGFLLPALAYAWDWIQSKTRPHSHREQKTISFDPSVDVQLSNKTASLQAVIYSTILTSILFALIHSDQLAHAYGPLSVLFCVSLVLTFVRLRTGSVAASALVHASYNFSIFLTLFISTGGYRHLEKLKG
ncbi:MAG: CPBP family intramembrane glutamic endopeptidase [Acidobacteriaceae bacterium]